MCTHAPFDMPQNGYPHGMWEFQIILFKTIRPRGVYPAERTQHAALLTSAMLSFETKMRKRKVYMYINRWPRIKVWEGLVYRKKLSFD